MPVTGIRGDMDILASPFFSLVGLEYDHVKDTNLLIAMTYTKTIFKKYMSNVSSTLIYSHQTDFAAIKFR